MRNKNRQTDFKFILLICSAIFIFATSGFSQNFKQENVRFQNGEVNLSGTLFLPESSEKVAAVVVLHGSGPDDGLEYKIYGEEFSKRGIATLVFDKRGFGKSGGDWRKRSFELMANDALAAVKYLQNRSEISADQVGLWGISQGGWTLAKAAAKSKNVAFVVSVAGNAVTPTQQEIWHKDRMYRALHYSEKARDTARKFWQMVFDWLVLVDEGKFPLPENVLESERSGASVGLTYDSLPDWEKIAQPVLLIHGEFDELSPANESISRIGAALAKGGNQNFTYKIFPKSSHTITTNKTGLEFDWNTNFADGYFDFTAEWILANANGKAFEYRNEPAFENFKPSPDFDENGKFWNIPFYGRAFPQIILIIVFPLVFLCGFIVSVVSFIRSKTFSALFTGIVYLLDFVLLIGFYIFLKDSIFPRGISLMESFSIPFWQKILPFFGSINLILTLILLAVLFTKRADLRKWQMFFGIFLIGFIPWLFYWNLTGISF